MFGKGPPLLSRMSLDHTPFCLKNQGMDPIEMGFLSHRSRNGCTQRGQGWRPWVISSYYSGRPGRGNYSAAPVTQSYEKQTVPVQTHHGDQVEGDQQTYLRVAEIVLGKSRVPLNAREIVDRGIEQGLFGDHIMGRTPQKSMQARLSMDILNRGHDSRFVRTARGRFTLR